jgi:hypothetical protein
MMVKQMEARYTLFDSVEEMLAPETLSELLSSPVRRVDCQPMTEHIGLAGGQLSYVSTNVGRLVLKRMSIETDWIMYATDDYRCRSVQLWRHGLLDRMRPHLEHKIVACAHEDNAWAILMHDLTGSVFRWGAKPIPPTLVPVFLDQMARLHAAFWNDPLLHNARLGLCDAAKRLRISSLALAQKHNGHQRGVIPGWVRGGWEVMEELLDPDVFLQMHSLSENPQPLLEALSRYPYTLVHGDYRAENLAHLKPDHPVAFDWQNAARSLMTIDLVWFAGMRYVRDAMGQAQAISYYRGRLETYLDAIFDDDEWQAMVDLGNLASALFVTCFRAYFSKNSDNPERRHFWELVVKERNRQVRDAMRWL